MKLALFTYSIVALLIMAPLFGPGFIFFLDFVWAPSFDLADATRLGASPSFPLFLLMKGLSVLIPAWILQKIVLTVTLMLPGIMMFALLRTHLSKTLAVLGGLLYMFNPYVFERFIIGHWNVLLGYGFFPLIVLLFNRFLVTPSWKHFIQFVIAFSIYPMVSIHWAYIASFFLATLAVVHVCHHKKVIALPSFITRLFTRRTHTPRAIIRDFHINAKRIMRTKGFWMGMLLFPIMFLALNSFWLVTFFDDKRGFTEITNADFSAFRTQADPDWGVVGNVLSLYGMQSPHFALPKELFEWWWLVTIAVMVLALIGAWHASRTAKDTRLPITAAILFIPSMIIAIGYGSAPTKPLIDLLVSSLPFFSGLRDTAKVIGVLAFIYALFVPYGLQCVLEQTTKRQQILKKPSRILAIVLVAFIPFLWAPALLWGAWGQLSSHPYPEDWHQTNDVLVTVEETDHVLVYPWRLYVQIDWADGALAANPSHAFFTSKMITSQTTENVFMLSRERSELDLMATHLVHSVESVEDNLTTLARHQVSHIMLQKIDDWEEYDEVLRESNVLTPVRDTNYISLYRVEYEQSN